MSFRNRESDDDDFDDEDDYRSKLAQKTEDLRKQCKFFFKSKSIPFLIKKILIFYFHKRFRRIKIKAKTKFTRTQK